MTIIDTHAHIDQIEDLSGALIRAHEAGVSDIVAMSVDLDSMKKLVRIVDHFQQRPVLFQEKATGAEVQTADNALDIF